MAHTIASVHSVCPDNAFNCLSELSSAVLEAHWNVMRKLLKAEDTDSARINAILRVGAAMNKAVTVAQELETEFLDDLRKTGFDD